LSSCDGLLSFIHGAILMFYRVDPPAPVRPAQKEYRKENCTVRGAA
jgi:hypothetical protein